MSLPGIDPAIQALVDARVKPAHDHGVPVRYSPQ
jgi:hypothetical protein